MRLLLCWIFPPLAVLLCGKPITAIFNFIFTLFFWFPGVAHATAVVENHLADKRMRKVTKAIHRPEWVRQLTEQSQPPPSRRLKAQPSEQFKGSYTVGRNGTKFRTR